MKKLTVLPLLAFLIAYAISAIAFASKTYLEGYEPDPHFPESRARKIYLLIENEKIIKKSTTAFQVDRETKKITEAQIGPVLLSAGFVDLHGHLKYNVLPLWQDARGQFGHRFQWRTLPSYKKNVTAPLNNPTLGDPLDPKSLYCQMYQYAEIKALAGGVTTVQGVGQDMPCTQGILARNVEIETDFGVTTDARTSMEVVNPDAAHLFQEKIFPHVIAEQKTISEVTTVLQATSGTLTSRQNDFLTSLHKYLDYLARMLPAGDLRGLIVHLSEGRSDDHYNKLEYKFARTLGLTEKGLIVIHGVGLDEKDLAHAAKNNISLVWSPFSNLLLYGDTLNPEKALKYNLNISLGSDWSPSGTKNLLDEVKIARRYVQTKGLKGISDKKLYEMMTVNPAKALQLQNRIGQLEVGYLADIVAIRLKSRRQNPYTQIITAPQSDIQYVMVGGELKIANNRLSRNQIHSEALITDNELSNNKICQNYRELNVMNSPLKLSELVTNMKSIFPQLDSLTACSDPYYRQTLENIFSLDWERQAPPTPQDTKSYDRLAEQIEQQLNEISSRP